MDAVELIREVEREHPLAVRLAEAVSLAVLVDPPLLRRARRELVPEADPGTEADLWSSPLVQSRSPDGLVLFPEVAQELRKRLAAHSKRLDHAWELTQYIHGHLSPALKLEEEIAWLSVSPSPDAARRIKGLLQSVLAAMVVKERRGLAHWAARALPALPAEVRGLETARLLGAGARLRLDGNALLLGEEKVPDWLTPVDLPRVPVRVRLLEGAVELDSSATDGNVIQVPETDPLLVDLLWTEAGEETAVRVKLQRGGGVTIAVPVDSLRLRTILGELYNVRAVGRGERLQDGIIDFSAERERRRRPLFRRAQSKSERRAMTVRDVKIKEISGVVFKVVVQTEHETQIGQVWANTAIHDQVFARRIGGVRFVRSQFPGGPEELTELGELAESMTWRCPLSGIPADGEKTVVYSPGGLPTPDQMAQALAEHLKVLQEADPGVIFGPDINCNEVVMQRLADAHGAGDHVSGLLHGKGGLSIDGQGYTARGLEAALVSTARRLGWDLSKMKAVIQGFGAVGAHTGRNLRKHGVAIHAVSTVHGALIAETDEGLDIEELFADWQRFREAGRIDDAFKKFLTSPPRGSRVADKNEIWSERAEIFVPAARTDVLATPEEVEEMRVEGNTAVMDVVRFVEATGVKVVVEGANHPVTDDAEAYLESRGVFILPDYLINCGGLIGCWADWVYRRELQQDGVVGEEWYHRLNESAPRYVSKIVEHNIPMVLDITGSRPEGMRAASYELAKRRRQELAAKYRAYSVGPVSDPDGRAFARLCMDELLR